MEGSDRHAFRIAESLAHKMSGNHGLIVVEKLPLGCLEGSTSVLRVAIIDLLRAGGPRQRLLPLNGGCELQVFTVAVFLVMRVFENERGPSPQVLDQSEGWFWPVRGS